jgi:hypothetical protein
MVLFFGFWESVLQSSYWTVRVFRHFEVMAFVFWCLKHFRGQKIIFGVDFS